MDKSPTAQNRSLKEAAVTFQRLVVAGRVSEAYENYISPDFRHHNPYFPGDAASLRAGMEENAAAFPDKIFEMQRVFEDGEYVVIHSRLQLKPDLPVIAVVHIFRFAEGLIVEEWDVGQQIPADSPNENGGF